MQTILVVEDERDIADLIGFNLERAGHRVVKVHNGLDAADTAIREKAALVVLDIMLPGKDGYAVFRDLRRDNRTRGIPVLILTARAQTEDRIQGLEAGADDYLVKPFSPKELMLRVAAILKRTQAGPGSVEYIHGPFRFDKNNLRFYLDGEPVDLTAIEFKLLLFLAERPGITQERDKLLTTVWGYSDEVHSRTLDTHMKRLRQKLGHHSSRIETVRGIGYLMATAAS